MTWQQKTERGYIHKVQIHKEALLRICKLPEYVAYRKRQWIHLVVYAVMTVGAAWVLSFLPFREARVLSEICISSGLILTVYGIYIVMRRPKVLSGRIVSMKPKKLIWLKGREGHTYLVRTESGIYRASCIYGRLYGVEKDYRENEPVWLLLLPSPYIMKFHGWGAGGLPERQDAA